MAVQVLSGTLMLAIEEPPVETTQTERLSERLADVLRRVPLYQSRVTGESPPPGQFLWLPFITKADIRHDFPRNFLGTEARLEELLEREVVELEHTSGTSEPRTPLLLPMGWWAEQERRALRLNPLAAEVLARTPDPRRVTINSPVCSSEVCFTGVPSRSERTVGSTLFLSQSRYPFLWSEADLARMAAEALSWNPQFLDVDPVYGVVFARYCERQGIRLPSLKFILCSYEYVSVLHRQMLERVFNVPVFNLYGSTETGHLLMEDAEGQMRPSLETAYLEVAEFDGADPVSDLELACSYASQARERPHRAINGGRNGSSPVFGELIVTALTNDLMPLVRYRIGDLVECSPGPGGGRYAVHGRVEDAFVTAGGRRVTTHDVDQCFRGIGGILHYQLLEVADDSCALRFVPDRAGPSAQEKSVLKNRLGELTKLQAPVRLETTDTLLAESSGKFRLVYPARKTPARP